MKIIALLLLTLPAFAQEPEYGWKELTSKTVSLKMGSFTWVKIPAFDLSKDVRDIKVSVLAEEGVTFGIFPYNSTKNEVELGTPPIPCGEVDVIETDAKCAIPVTEHILFVKDSRGLGTGIAALVSAVKAGLSAGPIDRASKPNKVKVMMYRWTCIKNCS